MREMGSDHVKSVGIWLRVSTEDQVRGESPEHHEARARQYADLKGWQVTQVYRLDAVSGKAVMAHSEARRMLADIRAGAISGLVFSKLARLARNTKELLDFAEVFRACDADMISLAESIDTSTPAGRLFFTMIAAMAQWEREEIADRVRASVPIRAKLGKPTGGRAPFGYRWVDKRLVVHPDEAPVRALVYELFVEHRRKKTVASLLNDRGYRTRSGKPFADTDVGRLLEDPTAKGLHRANYTQGRDQASHSALKPEAEWVWNEVEPIVSVELWEECASLLDARTRGRRPAKRATYLFSGIAVCECGNKMYVPARRNKYVCAACHMKIPLDDLEAVYRSALADFEYSPQAIAAHQQAAHDALRDKDALVETTENELKRLATAENELFELYHSGSLTKGDFARRHRPISERRAQLEDELPRLQADRDVLKIGLVSEQVLMEETNDLNTQWELMTFEQRRQMVERITDRLIVGKEGVDIEIQESPFGTSDQMATNGRGYVANLVPGVRLHLSAPRPEFVAQQDADLPTQLRQRRRALGHSVETASKVLGVRRMTLTAWEQATTEPPDRFYPALIRYLGREPWAKPEALGGLLQAERRRRGLAPTEAAQVIGISDWMLRRMEETNSYARGNARNLVERFLSGSD